MRTEPDSRPKHSKQPPPLPTYATLYNRIQGRRLIAVEIISELMVYLFIFRALTCLALSNLI